jgi:hypothetical protein
MVADFLGEGLAAGEPALALVTREHRAALAKELRGRHFDIEQMQSAGSLLILDAHEALASFMKGGELNRDLFRKNVMAVIDRLCQGRRDRWFRAYGELVNLLWQGGQHAAAVQLESLWNELQHTQCFAGLCGYAMDKFYTDAGVQDVHRAHTHVVSTAIGPAPESPETVSLSPDFPSALWHLNGLTIQAECASLHTRVPQPSDPSDRRCSPDRNALIRATRTPGGPHVREGRGDLRGPSLALARFGRSVSISRLASCTSTSERSSCRIRPFQILSLLLEHAGDMVTRDEIRAKVWSTDTTVEFEHGIATAVKKLRQALATMPSSLAISRPCRGAATAGWCPCRGMPRARRRCIQPVSSGKRAADSSGVTVRWQPCATASRAHGTVSVRIVLITGDAGIGKTALVDEFQQQASLAAPDLLSRAVMHR